MTKFCVVCDEPVEGCSERCCSALVLCVLHVAAEARAKCRYSEFGYARSFPFSKAVESEASRYSEWRPLLVKAMAKLGCYAE